MKTVARYSFVGRLKASLAKRLLRLVHRLTEPREKVADLVLVAIRDRKDSLNVELFGDPDSIKLFKERFDLRQNDTKYVPVSHYVKTTEQEIPSGS